MTEPDDRSIRRKARIAGVLYLIVIAGGMFAEGGALEGLVVHGDAAATARAIATHEALWRGGIAVHLATMLAGVPLAFLLYELFKPVQATLARCVLGFALMCMAIETTTLLGLYVPLAVAGEAFAGLAEAQRQALGYLGVRLYSMGFGFALMLFSGYCVLLAALILRSRLVPRLIGGLLGLAGLCYATNTLALLLAPPLADRLFPWIMLPCLVGELSLALWLAVMGVRAQPR